MQTEALISAFLTDGGMKVFDPELGWKIGNGEEYSDPDYQDEVESRQLYNTLETDIIPLFYDRGEDRLPRGWMKKIKVSMNKLGQFFNTHRMVIEYFKNYYYPSLQKRLVISEKKWEKAKKLTAWKQMVKTNWHQVNIKHIETENFKKELKVNEDLVIKAEIDLGNLMPQDVVVQIYYGLIDKQDDPKNNLTVNMTPEVKKNKRRILPVCGKHKMQTYRSAWLYSKSTAEPRTDGASF